MKKYVDKFIEYYTEMYGEPEFRAGVNAKVVSDEDVQNIFDSYKGFEGITVTELCEALEENYYIDYGFQDSF